MRVLQRGEAAWADRPNRYDLCLGTEAPAPHTSASVLVLCPDGLLAVEILTRGWDVPGGHLDEGESAREAAIREAREEAGLTLAPAELTLLGWAHLEVLAPKPAGYKYPYPHTYQPVFVAHVASARLTGLTTDMPEEVGEVRVVPFAQVETVLAHHGSLPLILHAMDEYARERKING